MAKILGKRGRGRPRKLEKKEVDGNIVKRGRGRPKGSLKAVKVGIKKGRGRPRKDGPAKIPSGRGRGRPRKHLDIISEILENQQEDTAPTNGENLEESVNDDQQKVPPILALVEGESSQEAETQATENIENKTPPQNGEKRKRGRPSKNRNSLIVNVQKFTPGKVDRESQTDLELQFPINFNEELNGFVDHDLDDTGSNPRENTFELPPDNEEMDMEKPPPDDLDRIPNINPFSVLDKMTFINTLATNFTISCSSIGNQVIFFHRSQTLTLTQHDPETVFVSGTRLNLPFGRRSVWKTHDWEQFEYSLRGRLWECFFDSPRIVNESSDNENNDITPRKQRNVFPDGEITEEDLGPDFSLRNKLTNEMFEDLADELLMTYEEMDHGFALLFAERKLRFQFTDHQSQGVIRAQLFEDDELSHDTCWLKLDHSQFLDAIHGRARTLIYGTPMEPVCIQGKQEDEEEDSREMEKDEENSGDDELEEEEGEMEKDEENSGDDELDEEEGDATSE